MSNRWVKDFEIVWLILLYLAGYGSGWFSHAEHVEAMQPPTISEKKITQEQIDDPELVECEFDEPITVVVSVLHYYDNYHALNHDYNLTGATNGPVFAWSECEWQEDNNYSACDIYTVHPEFVVADEAMDSLGHEVYHGSCGSEFHD